MFEADSQVCQRCFAQQREEGAKKPVCFVSPTVTEDVKSRVESGELTPVKARNRISTTCKRAVLHGCLSETIGAFVDSQKYRGRRREPNFKIPPHRPRGVDDLYAIEESLRRPRPECFVSPRKAQTSGKKLC